MLRLHFNIVAFLTNKHPISLHYTVTELGQQSIIVPPHYSLCRKILLVHIPKYD